MQYVRLGRSGLQVSRISLGSWLTYGNVVDQHTADAVVGRAIGLGINLLDTADVYNRGGGEKALAQAIRGRRREHLVIASKCYFPMSDDVNDRGLSRKHVWESVHQSLRRLGTDYVDLYQCHRPDPETPLFETAMAMDDLIRQGKVLYWGVSMWPAELIEEMVALCRDGGLHAPISNQPLYNLFEREIEAAVIPTCERLGVGQIVFSPLAQGVLTGKYRAGESFPSGTRASDSRVNHFLDRYLTQDRLRKAEAFAAVARELGASPAQVALAWCLRLQNVRSVIVGASRPEQLEDNVGALDVPLNDDRIARVEAAFR